ncbi:MAG TPA: SusC/RagA family protein, partial [Zunongwangia profunda]|nr:SusC/RagA family protein [Zunongwangia profunda]
MKTFLLLLCTTVFGFSPKTSFSQENIVISKDQKASIDDVFHIIRAQTDYTFIYAKSLFENTPEIQLKKGDINIDSLLNRISKNADVFIRKNPDHTITIKKSDRNSRSRSDSQTVSQQLEIKGRVITANDKLPLPGASIIEKGTMNGVVTDFNGDFSISITNKNAILVISYVGYATKEIPVNDQTNFEIVLEEDTDSLDEVVIVGFGKQKKISLTGAVSTVDVEDMKQNPTSSISNALAGNVAGIMGMMQSGQPGRNISEFWIRGISTFGGGTNPLVLVDNIERDLNELNIEDIKSISVLKDAAETAMYGSRGANGVILITTKRGSAGKININFKDEFIYNTRTITPDFEDGVSYANLLNEARITRNEGPIYQPEELEILRLGLDPDLYPNVDWKDELLRDGAMTYRANLNMSGGGETS